VRILVTGAAGFIASHLAERLLEAGSEVVGIDAFTTYYDRATKQRNCARAVELGMDLRELDLVDADLDALFEGVDQIYHAAAQPGISATTPFDDYLRNNIIATHRLVEAAGRCETLKLFINMATSSIYGADATGPETTVPMPTSYYGVTKLAAEQLVLAAQRETVLPACSLRLFSVYGPRERPEKLFPRLIRAIARDEPMPLYEGAMDHTRSFTYIDDIIDGLIAAGDHADAVVGQVINLGSTIQRTTGQAIEIVQSIMGKAARFDPRPRRPGDQIATHADITKARALIGYTPKTTPEAGLARAVAWFSDERATA